MIKPHEVRPALLGAALAEFRVAQLEKLCDAKIVEADQDQRWPATLQLGSMFSLECVRDVAQRYIDAGWSALLTDGGRYGISIRIQLRA